MSETINPERNTNPESTSFQAYSADLIQKALEEAKAGEQLLPDANTDNSESTQTKHTSLQTGLTNIDDI